MIETEGWASSSIWQWQRGGEGDPKRARASSKDPPWHQPIFCCLVCDWQVFGGCLQKVLDCLCDSKADLNKLLCFFFSKKEVGVTHAQLATKDFSCPCSGKAFLCEHNKTDQLTSQPLPLSAASNLDAAHAGEPHNPLLVKTEDPNKKLLTAVWRVHAVSGEQLDLHRTYQPGSVRKEVCTCGLVVPLRTTPCLMNRHKVGWLLVQREDQQIVRCGRLAGILHPSKPWPQKTLSKS